MLLNIKAFFRKTNQPLLSLLLASALLLATPGAGASSAADDWQTKLDWIMEHRIVAEGYLSRDDMILQQIVEGGGELRYVVRWQSYQAVAPAQRAAIAGALEKAVNEWTDGLTGADGWPYRHVNVEIVGWAVLDSNVLEDPAPGEIIYDDNAVPRTDAYEEAVPGETIPALIPCAPDRLNHVWRTDNGLQVDSAEPLRFDMYLWGVQGMNPQTGFGYNWGQELADTAILALDDESYSILLHEMGHGLGLPDFYGSEGAEDGIPVGGFPTGVSIMEAGSTREIQPFGLEMLRMVWNAIRRKSTLLTD